MLLEDEEEEPQPVVAHKRARKSGSEKGGKTAKAFLGSPQKRKQAVGIRTRRETRLEDEEEAMVKQEDTDEMVIKQEGTRYGGEERK